MSKALASMAKRFRSAFRESSLQFNLNVAVANHDAPKQQQLAGALLREFPRSRL